MEEGIKEAADCFLQRGGKMRTRAPNHPSSVRDMRSVYDIGCGKRKRSDAKGVTPLPPRAPPVNVNTKLYRLNNQQKVNA